MTSSHRASTPLMYTLREFSENTAQIVQVITEQKKSAVITRMGRIIASLRPDSSEIPVVVNFRYTIQLLQDSLASVMQAINTTGMSAIIEDDNGLTAILQPFGCIENLEGKLLATMS